MEIQTKRDGETLTLFVAGRIDANTSPRLQEEILRSFQKSSRIIVDFKEVEYISSAGLRALLIGQKTADSKRAEFKLNHVREAVQSVFDMTGFSGVLHIEN